MNFHDFLNLKNCPNRDYKSVSWKASRDKRVKYIFKIDGGSPYRFTDHETIWNGPLQKKIELKSINLRKININQFYTRKTAVKFKS